MSFYMPYGTGRKRTKDTDATVRVFFAKYRRTSVLPLSCGVLERSHFFSNSIQNAMNLWTRYPVATKPRPNRVPEVLQPVG